MRPGIVTMVVAVLVIGPLANSAPRLHGQARDQRPLAASPAAWGTPVEGVQLRLAVASNAPVDIRIAVVHAFLRPPVDRGSRQTSASGPSLMGMMRVDMASLPNGPAGAAIERLIDAALDDRRQRMGLRTSYEGLAYADPRVCDMAAFVFASRWPERYRFTWPEALATRDAEIERIRRERQR